MLVDITTITSDWHFTLAGLAGSAADHRTAARLEEEKKTSPAERTPQIACLVRNFEAHPMLEERAQCGSAAAKHKKMG
ncbi:unnamed protein product [Caretta caretta]